HGRDDPAVHDALRVEVVGPEVQGELRLAVGDASKLHSGPLVERRRGDARPKLLQVPIVQPGPDVLVHPAPPACALEPERSRSGLSSALRARGGRAMDPKEIFELIIKADERLKYATPDKADARVAQARNL